MSTDRKKRNPQDATLRNVRAAKRREASLEARVQHVEEGVALALRAVLLLREGLQELLADKLSKRRTR